MPAKPIQKGDLMKKLWLLIWELLEWCYRMLQWVWQHPKHAIGVLLLAAVALGTVSHDCRGGYSAPPGTKPSDNAPPPPAESERRPTVSKPLPPPPVPQKHENDPAGVLKELKGQGF